MRGKPTDRYHWVWHRMLRRFAQRVLLRGLIRSIVSVEVEGSENAADLDGPFILISNHSSHLDAPVLISSLPWSLTKNLATAVAADYFYSQKWRSTLTSIFFNSYPVERDGRRGGGGGGSGRSSGGRGAGGRGGKPKRAGLSVSLLRQDVPLLIFPEGTRSRTGEMANFKSGVAALARALRVPVLPVALVGAHEAMPVGTSWPKPGRQPVRVLIGEPVRVQRGEALTALNQRVESRVRAMLETGTVAAGMDAEDAGAGEIDNQPEPASNPESSSEPELTSEPGAASARDEQQPPTQEDS